MNWQPDNSVTYGGYKSGEYHVFEDETEETAYACAFFGNEHLKNFYWGDFADKRPIEAAKEFCENHARPFFEVIDEIDTLLDETNKPE